MQTHAPEKTAQEPRSARRRMWLPGLVVALVIALAALVALGTWALVGTDTSDLTSDEQAMVDTIEDWFAKVNAGDVEALPGYFTSDVSLVTGPYEFTVDEWLVAMADFIGVIQLTMHDTLVSGNYVIMSFTEEWEDPIEKILIWEFDPDSLKIKRAEWFPTS